jgi:hypothetical protein
MTRRGEREVHTSFLLGKLKEEISLEEVGVSLEDNIKGILKKLAARS